MRRFFFRKAGIALGCIGLLFGILVFVTEKTLNGSASFEAVDIVRLSFVALLTLAGTIVGMILSRFYYENYQDHLTGAWNRKFFFSRFRRLKRENKAANVCLAMIDVDNFKLVNDKMGHTEGDKTLCQLVKTLKANCRQTDEVVRLGGDEFAVIFYGAELSDVYTLAERMRKEVEEECSPVTISIGVAEVEAEISMRRIIESVDSLLYDAKLEKNKVIAMKIA